MSSQDTLPKKITPRRRSLRLLLSIRVLIRGTRPNGSSFSAEVSTVVVSAHGALVVASEPFDVGQLLIIRNLISKEEQMCKVIQIGTSDGSKREVGLEFLEPAPRFWRVAFPPDDWSTSSPEAKQLTAPPNPVLKSGPTNSGKPPSPTKKFPGK